jgi:hypothetical protein
MEPFLHASMRPYDRHTEKCISYDTAVPDKTKFTSLYTTDRKALGVVKTALLCVRGSRCSEKQTQKNEVCNTFFVFIAMDQFRNKFYCRLHSDQLERQNREAGRNGERLKTPRVQK